MAEELQGLLERIQEEGVKKADSEKERIITEAKSDAEKILADAKKKSEKIIKKSEEDAKRNEERAASTVRQAARDIILALNDELQTRLTNVVKECIGEAMTPEIMGKLILDEFVENEKGHLQEVVQANNSTFDAAETEVLGINHSEAGALVLNKWNFPDALIAAARWHHHPEYAEEHKEIAMIVHIADVLAYSEGVGCGIDGMKYDLSADAINFLGLKKTTLEYVASQTLSQMQQLEQILKQ